MATPEAQDGSSRSKRRIKSMDAVVWALTTGIMGGLGLFVATNWLVWRGGQEVGKHLGLLSNYFIGYSVTFVGSLVGFAYAFVVGFLATWVLVTVYNVVAGLRHGDSRT